LGFTDSQMRFVRSLCGACAADAAGFDTSAIREDEMAVVDAE
jgi:hypothetical protein